MTMKETEFLFRSYDDCVTDDERAEYIECLETFVTKCNESEAKGVELYTDSIYDTAKELLKMYAPDSPVLSHVWSEDADDGEVEENLDKFLMSHPMMSICTCKSFDCKDIEAFRTLLPAGTVDVSASFKENGHGIRIVYQQGTLVKARSRGRRTNGRDLTPQLINMLGEYNEALAEFSLVELRGEVVIPLDSMDAAREFNPSVKSPFTGVSSLLADSASAEANQLLHFVAYDIMSDSLSFETLEDKLTFLDELGFVTPDHGLFTLSRETFDTDIREILGTFEEASDGYAYFTDGVVVAINNIELFDEFGSDDTRRLGNIALKIGKWAQDMYYSTIVDILWKEGKTKVTPVALIEPTLTANGATVSNVPLYAPCHILALEAYIGSPITFRFGGESGVVPCFSDGTLLKDVD